MAELDRELREAIEKSFSERLKSDKTANALLEKIGDGKATLKEAESYAYRVGEILAETYKAEISADILPDGMLTEEIANAILVPALRHNHELVSNATADTIEALNRNAGIRLKAVRPNIDNDRIIGLVGKAGSYDSFDQAAWVLDGPVVNFSQNACDRMIDANVNAHFKAGLKPKVIRETLGDKPCAWCKLLAKEYDYPVPREVYQRHERCECLIIYDPQKGKLQNAHTKKEYESIRDAELEAKAEARRRKLEQWKKEEEKYPDARREILRKVKSGEYSLKLKHQKYLQHVEGTQQYKEATRGRGCNQSYLVVSEKEAQDIINKYTGLGDPAIYSNGSVGKSEYISLGRRVGFYFEKGEDVPLPTDRVQIVHGQYGSHIIPVRPKEIIVEE